MSGSPNRFYGRFEYHPGHSQLPLLGTWPPCLLQRVALWTRSCYNLSSRGYPKGCAIELLGLPSLTFTLFNFIIFYLIKIVAKFAVGARVAQWKRNRFVIGRLVGSNPLSGWATRSKRDIGRGAGVVNRSRL